jgi:hypothetical protein
MTWTFDGSTPTFDTGAGATFDGASSGGGVAPVITLNPSNATIASGSTATFNAAATGTPTPTVQWQVSVDGGTTWNNVTTGSGGTTTSYTTAALLLTDSGGKYRAIFTNSSGSATTTVASVTVLSTLFTGGRTMEFLFGPGQLYVTPLTNADGSVIASPSPRKLGAFQDATFDNSAETKMMYGANQYPLAVGRGKAKLSMKAKMGQLSVDQWNAVFIGQPAQQSNQIVAAVNDNTGILIPATPFTISAVQPVTIPLTQVLVPNAGTFSRDLGVVDGNGNAYQAQASAGSLTTGQYNVSAGGVYTFASADAGKRVFISFVYTATSTSAKSLTVLNLPMGYAPFVQLDFYSQYGGNQLLVTLYQAICIKASFGTKLDDFAYPDLEFDGFVDSQNRAYNISASQ